MRLINVCVVYALPKKQVELCVQVPEVSTVSFVIRQSGIVREFPELMYSKMVVGIFGRIVSLGHYVQVDDRIEIYRPLIHDAKTLRRQRVKNIRHGSE